MTGTVTNRSGHDSEAESNSSPIVRISNLSLNFGERGAELLRVLENISLEIGQREFVSVIGPSGCGKTSLLHVIAGLQTPSSGDVELSGANAALVFQRPMLLPWRSVLANAIYGLEAQHRDLREARESATELLTKLNLGDHLNDYPHQLSEGMKQRVNLARALLVEPDILLMDEPFAAVDELTRRTLHDELLSIWEEIGLAICFVSHSLDEVAYLSDRVLVLSSKPAKVVANLPVEIPREKRGDLHSGEIAKTAQSIREIIQKSN